MYTHIFTRRRTPHTCICIVTTENVSQKIMYSDDRECISRKSDGAAKKNQQKRHPSVSLPRKKVRTFSSSLVIDGVVHGVIILLLLWLSPLFFRGLFFLGSPGISVAKRTLKYKDAKGKRRKKTQKDWKSYKDTLKHNHLDFVTAFLLYFSKHFLFIIDMGAFEHQICISVGGGNSNIL